MAKQHFLQANFTGSLGALTGARVKGQNIVKTKKEVIQRNGSVSNTAWANFTALHRVACAIAPATRSTIGKGTKIAEQGQKIEKLWKSWMAGGGLPPERFQLTTLNIIGYDLQNLIYDKQTYTLRFDIRNLRNRPFQTEVEFLFFILNPQGNVFAIHFFPFEENSVVIQTNGQPYSHLNLASVIIQYNQGKYSFVSASCRNFLNEVN